MTMPTKKKVFEVLIISASLQLAVTWTRQVRFSYQMLLYDMLQSFASIPHAVTMGQLSGQPNSLE